MSAATLDEVLARYGTLAESAVTRALPASEGVLARLHDAMRYSAESGGKRIRPVFCLAACEAVAGPEALERAFAPAAALELVHTYSLIHDDLPCMDDDDLRRGRPSNHRVYGEALAVLAGDALLTRAFEVLAEAPGIPAEARLAMVATLARAAGSLGMVGGQALDIAAEGDAGIDARGLEEIHTRKTGALFGAACRLGGLAGGGSPDALGRLQSLGENVGLAFQAADDLLDELGATDRLGKAAGRDRDRGKATYPAVLGMAESRRRVAELAAAAERLAETFGPSGRTLGALVRRVAERAP